MISELLDMQDTAGLLAFAEGLVQRYPGLNAVVHMAGIGRAERLTEGSDVATIHDTVSTNLLAPMVLTGALLPHLMKQAKATIITVTSGLAFTPLAMTPT
jgi:uncharacterized oxidoreductase